MLTFSPYGGERQNWAPPCDLLRPAPPQLNSPPPEIAGLKSVMPSSKWSITTVDVSDGLNAALSIIKFADGTARLNEMLSSFVKLIPVKSSSGIEYLFHDVVSAPPYVAMDTCTSSGDTPSPSLNPTRNVSPPDAPFASNVSATTPSAVTPTSSRDENTPAPFAALTYRDLPVDPSFCVVSIHVLIAPPQAPRSFCPKAFVVRLSL